MFEEEGSQYWILAITFVLIVAIVVSLFLFGFFRLNPLPEPPTNIKITQVGNALRLSWQKSTSPDVIGYNIYRSRQYSVLGEKINIELIDINEWFDETLFEDGTYFYTIRAVDSIQEEDNINQVSFYFDTAPPYDSEININDGAEFTSTKNVKLYLSSKDSKYCRYKNENLSWSEYEPYTIIKAWELVDEEGIKIVYYQCQDPNHNVGPVASDSIVLDKTEPIITFIKPIESIYSSEDSIVFSFEVEDNYANTVDCYIYIDGEEKFEERLDYLNTPLEASPEIEALEIGNYTVSLVCKDTAGNKNQIDKKISVVSPGEYRSKYVNISINDDAEKTEQRDVELYLTSNLAQLCRFKNERRSWSDWEPFESIIEWTLSSGGGIKTVYVECLDINNRSLGINWDTIEYEKEGGGDGYAGPPTNLNIKINNGDKYTNSLMVELTLSAKYADECRYRSVDSIFNSWSAWKDYRTSVSWGLGTLADPEGEMSIEYQCRNNYGESGVVEDSIIYDITPPEGSIDLEGEAISDGRVRLFWRTAAAIGERDLGFNIYRKRLTPTTEREYRLVDTTTSTNWIDYDTVGGYEYSYYIKLVDGAGNEGEDESNYVRILADSEDPDLTLMFPEDEDEFEETHINIIFSVEDDISNTVVCEYSAGGSKKNLGEFSTETIHTEEITLTTHYFLGEEDIRVCLYCEDEAGNEDSSCADVIFIYHEYEEGEDGRPPID